MSLPFSTTTVTVTKPTAGTDPYEAASGSTTVASGVAAVVGSPTGNESQVGGQQEAIDATLWADPIANLDHYCSVTDDETDKAYTVVWVHQRVGLDLDHTVAGLRAVNGGTGG